MGSYNRLDMRGSFEVALGKNLFARFSGSSKHRDGYVTILDFTCDMIRKGTPQLAGIGDGLGQDGSATGVLDGQPDVVPVGSVADNAFGIPISTSPNGTDKGCKIGEMGDEDVQSGRGIVRYVASDDLEFTFTGDVTNQNQHSPADYLAGTNPNLFLVSQSNARVNIPNFGVPYDNRFVPSDPYTSYSTFKDPGVTFGVPNLPGSNYFGAIGGTQQQYPGGPDTPNIMQVLHWGVSGKMDWNINQDLNATVILAYRNFNSFFGRDSDGSPIPLNHTLDTYKDKQYTVEGRLSGNLNWMDYTTEWTTGVFYYDAKDYNSNISILHMGIIGAGDVDRIDDQKSTKLGVFLHTITDVTDKIRFTAGVRWTHDSKDIVQYRPKRILEDRPLVTADYLFPPTPLGLDSFRVSPMASLSYQWNDDVMTYFTWARGFRGGGFNPRPNSPATVGTFGPEDVENFEIGAKTDLFDKRLRFNIATFYITNISSCPPSCRNAPPAWRHSPPRTRVRPISPVWRSTSMRYRSKALPLTVPSAGWVFPMSVWVMPIRQWWRPPVLAPSALHVWIAGHYVHLRSPLLSGRPIPSISMAVTGASLSSVAMSVSGRRQTLPRITSSGPVRVRTTCSMPAAPGHPPVEIGKSTLPGPTSTISSIKSACSTSWIPWAASNTVSAIRRSGPSASRSISKS